MKSNKYKKYKVLYIEHQAAMGGGSILLLQLLENLDREKYEPYVVCPTTPHPLFAKKLAELNVPHYIVFLSWWNKKKRWNFKQRTRYLLSSWLRSGFHFLSIFRIIRLIIKLDIDIVHTNSSVVWYGAIAAKLTGRKHVWHIREKIGSKSITDFWFGWKLAVKIIKLLSTKIISMSIFINESFKSYNGNRKIIYDILDNQKFNNKIKIKKFDIHMHCNLPKECKIVAMVANLTKWKRHDIFMHVAALVNKTIPETKFIIFGRKNEKSEYFKFLVNLINRLNLVNIVYFAGSIDRDLNFLSDIDILLHPTLNEPFGMGIIEAMAIGKPVIGFHSGGLKETVVSGETGFLVLPEDINGMADKTILLLQDTELRIKMGKASQKRAEELFLNKKRFSNEINSIYEQILAKNG